ncbi:MAG: histidinol-phosphate transaminase [Victivallaceae bacterium]
MSKSYFRKAVDAMSAYVPGEQPKIVNLVKINTNENPYPPAPGVSEVIRNFNPERLRLYPKSDCDDVVRVIADLNNVETDMVIAGNGSDDILNIAMRCFCSPDLPLACFKPSYSLYPVLAAMQEAQVRQIALNDDFSIPENAVEQAAGANLLIIARPNAPTGNSFPMSQIRKIIEDFDGIVLIDEAYADFADDNCMSLVKEYDNLMISRTMSKSYALAGLRFGYGVAAKTLIDGMMKIRDSYNVDMLTQEIARAAFLDQDYLAKTKNTILATRARLERELSALGFSYVKSQANFLFASPPDRDGKRFFDELRQNSIIVRYFPGEVTGCYVRISVGSDTEIERLLTVAQRMYK